MEDEKSRTYQLVLVVRNQPGVLVRCAQVLSRRGQNIESLQVAAIPETPELSKMIIIAAGKPSIINQIVSQLTKLIDVINVS